MRKLFLPLALIGLLMPASAIAQDARHPVISGHGAITPMADAANMPDKALAYRALFNITKGAEPGKVNPSLDKVARFVNLLGSGGVLAKRGDLVAIIHGAATPLVLSDAAYRARFGKPNPNTPLIAALRQAGVEVHVCGQALAGHKIGRDELNGDIIVDLSAMTTLSTLQLKGWALIPD